MDYHETFVSIVSLVAVRLLLAIVAHNDLKPYQIDLVTAFLNVDLEKNIYMEVPAGSRIQVGSIWYAIFSKTVCSEAGSREIVCKSQEFLRNELVLKGCRLEPSLDVKHTGDSMILVLLSFYDLLINGDKPLSCSFSRLISALKTELPRKGLRVVTPKLCFAQFNPFPFT